MSIQRGIADTAQALGMSPTTLATIISYETAGTFDPAKKGPTTKWGQHKGFIQFGEPQAKQYGVDWRDPVNSQLGANGAVAKYFRDRGWKPGMNEMQAYSIVNAGAPNKFNASDTKAGGAPGTVRDKVLNQFAPHRAKAQKLMGGEYMPSVPRQQKKAVSDDDFADIFGGEWKPSSRFAAKSEPKATGEKTKVDDLFAGSWQPSRRYTQPTQPRQVVAPTGGLYQPAITGDVPPMPGSPEETARNALFEANKPKPKTVAQAVGGGIETALAMGTGATTGTLGQVAGTLQGVGREVLAGEFGSNAAAQRIQQTAMDAAGKLTYAPRTETGQQYMQATGEALAPLTVVAPLAQAATVGAFTRGAALPRTAGRAEAISTGQGAAAKTAMDAKTAGAYNIPVMTSDIAPPTTWSGRMSRAIGERVPIVGTGGMRQSQQAARVSAVQDVMRNYGGEVGTPAVNDVMANLLQKRGSDLSKYSKLKTDVIDKQAGAPVNVANTTAAIDAQIAKLQGMQTKAVNPLIGKLEDYKQAFSNQDLPTIELLRKQLGDELQSPDMATVKTAAGKATSSVYGALKQDMGDHIKQFGDRRDAQKWQVANARLSDMMTDQNVTGLKSALKRGEATPETVRTLLFSKKPSDVELLRKNLTPEGRDAAKQAIMQEAYAKIGQEASPERFVSQMDKLSTQTGVMLNSAEKAELQGLVDALKLTKQASVANFKPATGAEMTGFATPAALTYVAGGNPVAGVAMTAGAGILARAYESAPIRELMIKMGRASGAAEKRRIYDTMLSVANNLDAVTKGTAAGANAGLLAVPQSDKESGLLGAIGR